MPRSQTILVVDDDQDLLFMCAKLLRAEGYPVEEASSGSQALEKLVAHYDIVLTDLMMPGMSGIELLRGVKARSPSTDVILMTGAPSLDTAIEAVKEGAYDYIRKPVTKDELRTVLRRCSEARATKEELATEKHLREELQAAYQELKRMEQLKEGFICRVSHELRTPMAQILGCIEAAARNQGDAQCSAEKLKTALDGAQRLREVVEDIVSFAEIQDPGMDVDKSDVEVAPVIQKVVEETSPEWKARGIKVSAFMASEPVHVMADRELISKALRHLVLNAIRFNRPNGAVDIVVQSSPTGVEFAIKDTGEGVPLDQRLTIFDAFYQIADFMTRKVRGLGLGLALVKRIAEAHGGSVSVESTPGEGSTFWFRLPPP
ncbi:MAG: hybrid sensor histidine kinase/response regulator [Elusimicrobiota bacterium]|jgi:signal transduction histidine kinase